MIDNLQPFFARIGSIAALCGDEKVAVVPPTRLDWRDVTAAEFAEAPDSVWYRRRRVNTEIVLAKLAKRLGFTIRF